MPPRHLKSMFASIFYPTWRLGHCPDAKIICASYSEELGDLFSRHTRQLMRATWYREAFPNTQLSDENQEEIRNLKSPMVAARMGRSRKRPLRKDWESVKVQVMRRAAP
jgi:hypothetical protein